MKLGKVIGKIITSNKIPPLNNQQFSMVEELGSNLKTTGNMIIAIDLVNAGKNDLVLYTSGSAATNLEYTSNSPIDHLIVAIVDKIYNGDKISK